MNKIKILLMLLSVTFTITNINAQTCKEMYVKANSYFNAGKFEEAKNIYQQVINCGENFFIKDSRSKIKLIEEITYKAKKSIPFGLSQNNILIPYQGGDAVVTVNGGKSWKIAINSDWCTIKKSGNQIIISSKENTDLNERTAKIQVTCGTQYRTIIVTNEGAPEMLRSSVENIMFPSKGETNIIDIFANTKWEIKDVPNWISANKESGKIELTAQENDNNTARRANVRIVSPSNSVIIINIFQGAGEEKLSFSKNEIKFGPNGGDEFIKVYTDAKGWKFGDFPHWCQLTNIGNDSIKIHCTPNEANNQIREASINVTTGLQTLGINVYQEPKPFVTQIPKIGIGGKTVSFGITAGYIFPIISTTSGNNYKGSVVNYGLGNKQENASYKSSSGFTIGVNTDIKLYKNLYLMTGFDFIHYKYKNEFNQTFKRTIAVNSFEGWYMSGIVDNQMKEEYTMNTLELPIILSYRFPITRISHFQINLGPVISCGLTGNMEISGAYDSEKIYKYKYINHQMTNELYDNDRYSTHKTCHGKFNLYDNQIQYSETFIIGQNVEDIRPDVRVADSPLKRLNIGARVGVAYEYAGISFAIQYNMMLSNMANNKYWNSDRWTIFDQTSNTLMSGYRQRNNYLSIKIGYTFRY